MSPSPRDPSVVTRGEQRLRAEMTAWTSPDELQAFLARPDDAFAKNYPKAVAVEMVCRESAIVGHAGCGPAISQALALASETNGYRNIALWLVANPSLGPAAVRVIDRLTLRALRTAIGGAALHPGHPLLGAYRHLAAAERVTRTDVELAILTEMACAAPNVEVERIVSLSGPRKVRDVTVNHGTGVAAALMVLADLRVSEATLVRLLAVHRGVREIVRDIVKHRNATPAIDQAILTLQLDSAGVLSAMVSRRRAVCDPVTRALLAEYCGGVECVAVAMAAGGPAEEFPRWRDALLRLGPSAVLGWATHPWTLKRRDYPALALEPLLLHQSAEVRTALLPLMALVRPPEGAAAPSEPSVGRVSVRVR